MEEVLLISLEFPSSIITQILDEEMEDKVNIYKDCWCE